ncbi:MAG: glutaredoxin 3, partial [Burkholderiaceae bacterium]|nr:glutaredoxin 3 [Burkholderiaceae bacterium]
ALLAQRGYADVEKVRVDLQPEEREVMMQRTGRHTVPQIFIGERHIGGCDDLMALDASGGLLPLLEADN